MTREEAKRFWLIRYENAKDFSDPHWEAQERREHREYVEALRMAIEALQREEAEEKGYCHRIRPSNVEVVVRCKDCKHKVVTKDGEYNPEDIVCDYWMSDGLEANDFCSYGERKGSDEE